MTVYHSQQTQFAAIPAPKDAFQCAPSDAFFAARARAIFKDAHGTIVTE